MATAKRPAMTVTRDSDGGLTIDDHLYTGLVVSIIGSSPQASGPRGLHIEVYPYTMDKKVEGVAVPTRTNRRRHIAFYMLDPKEQTPDLPSDH